jgi:hypothetical protein
MGLLGETHFVVKQIEHYLDGGTSTDFNNKTFKGTQA